MKPKQEETNYRERPFSLIKIAFSRMHKQSHSHMFLLSFFPPLTLTSYAFSFGLIPSTKQLCKLSGLYDAYTIRYEREKNVRNVWLCVRARNLHSHVRLVYYYVMSGLFLLCQCNLHRSVSE